LPFDNRKDMKIEIRPVPNRNRIREFSEDLEHFSQAHVLAPLVDPVTRRYVTGLSEEDVAMLKGKGFPYNLDDTYVRGTPHEFWESQLVKVELRSGPLFLFPDRSDIDFVKWRFLAASSYVYASEEEMATGSKPQATHYIYDEAVSTVVRATALQRRNALLNKLSKTSLQRKRDLIMVVLNENTEGKGEDHLTVRIDEMLESREHRAQLEQLLMKRPEETALLAEVKSALQKGVLRLTKRGIYYFESNLGFTEEDVRDFLSKQENQELYLSIKQKI